MAVARSLVALHGTDPSSVYVGCWARMAHDAGPPGAAADPVAAVERALYEERSLLRMLAMRRTVFVTPLEYAPVLQAACSRAVAERERRTTLKYLAADGIGGRTEASRARWLREAEEAALRVLEERGAASAAELAAADPLLGTTIVQSRGKPYEARQNIASRIVLLLAAEGRAVRGRPRGSWTSHQYQWSALRSWLPELPDGLPEIPVEEARAALARAWLGSFGPGTAADLQWWTGWTKAQTLRALAAVGAVEVEVEVTAGAGSGAGGSAAGGSAADASGGIVTGGAATGFLLPEDLDPPEGVDQVEPWAALLPGLDSTPMGWRDRDWYLGPHGPRLFDTAGNVGPTVWWNGRIVGGWAQRASGEIVVRLLEDAGADALAAAETEAERLSARLGPVRLSPRTRGRTWLEQELAASS